VRLRSCAGACVAQLVWRCGLQVPLTGCFR
jgi:hypothetical protein